MPVSRVECQSEWLSIRDVAVVVAASLGTSSSGDDCFASSLIRLKAASGPPPLLLQGLSVSRDQGLLDFGEFVCVGAGFVRNWLCFGPGAQNAVSACKDLALGGNGDDTDSFTCVSKGIEQ